jgi:hypothetical protein
MARVQAGRHASSDEGCVMDAQEFEIIQLRHDLMAAETEIRELRHKLLEELLKKAKLEGIALKDLIQIMEGMK